MKDRREDKTNWSQSVTGVVIREGKVLLARHTYGGGKGMLIVPGGYVEQGELPEETLVREYLEETNITVKPREVIGIRCNTRDWYLAFLADYVSGEARSDGDENSEVVWMDVREALQREDVPDLTKKLIDCALEKGRGFQRLSYKTKSGNGFLYGTVQRENTEKSNSDF